MRHLNYQILELLSIYMPYFGFWFEASKLAKKIRMHRFISKKYFCIISYISEMKCLLPKRFSQRAENMNTKGYTLSQLEFPLKVKGYWLRVSIPHHSSLISFSTTAN
jgi:hypothetical protein